MTHATLCLVLLAASGCTTMCEEQPGTVYSCSCVNTYLDSRPTENRTGSPCSARDAQGAAGAMAASQCQATAWVRVGTSGARSMGGAKTCECTCSSTGQTCMAVKSCPQFDEVE